jgi:hypothetical protein
VLPPRHPPLQSNKPLGKLRRKTVYFVKLQAARVESDTIQKEARRARPEGVWAQGPGAQPAAASKQPRRKRTCLRHPRYPRGRRLLQVLHGELTEAPLETLSAVAQNVFLPLLSSSHNQEGWPDVVAHEVTENMHKFVANGEAPPRRALPQCASHPGAAAFTLPACPSPHASPLPRLLTLPALAPTPLRPAVKVSIGESKGQTLLPLPTTDPGSVAVAPAPNEAAAGESGAAAGAASRLGHLPPAEAEKVHILESAITTWTRQIKKVLHADPDAALKVRVLSSSGGGGCCAACKPRP